jgi:hypothetical protein
MMNCEQFTQNLSPYVDGDLPGEHADAMDFHASHCAACQARLDDVQTVRAALRDLPETPADPALSRAIVSAMRDAALRREREHWSDFRWLLRRLSVRPMATGYGVGLAITAMLFVGVLVSFKPVMRLTQGPEYNVIYMPVEDMRPFVTRAQNARPVAYTRPTLGTVSPGFSSLPSALFLTDEEGGVVVIAEVSPTGQARCVRLVSPNTDARTAAAIDAALQRTAFRPALTKQGNPIATQIVFLVDQVLIKG